MVEAQNYQDTRLADLIEQNMLDIGTLAVRVTQLEDQLQHTEKFLLELSTRLRQVTDILIKRNLT